MHHESPPLDSHVQLFRWPTARLSFGIHSLVILKVASPGVRVLGCSFGVARGGPADLRPNAAAKFRRFRRNAPFLSQSEYSRFRGSLSAIQTKIRLIFVVCT